MLVYPEVQKKAQQEIDRVVGNERLPDFTDKDSLPYVFATMWESIRWKQGAPLGTLNATLLDGLFVCNIIMP